MRKLIFLLILLPLLTGCHEKPDSSTPELSDLYDRLDSEIRLAQEYDLKKNRRIDTLRHAADTTSDVKKRIKLVNSLIKEFDAYNADSALHYINLNLESPEAIAQRGTYTRLRIKKADIYAHAGLFSDALSILFSIPSDSIGSDLKEEYYATFCATYQYLSEYTNEHETAQRYETSRALYADSVGHAVTPESFNHMVYVMSQTAREGNYGKAIEVLSRHLEEYPSGSREYSILASTLAYIHKTSGHPEDYQKYIILSAISDLKGSIKENVSFREIATERFEKGDIDRANLYLKKSFADANFYSARMRNAQSSKMLPVIDEAHTANQQALTYRLRVSFLISSVLAFILIVSLFFLWRLLRQTREANAKVRDANAELSGLSAKLAETNSDLTVKNDELRTISARLKNSNEELEKKNVSLREMSETNEQYAGLFMEYCSSAISTLQQYQQSLRVLFTVEGKREALRKKLESSEVSDNLLKNFYLRFDEAILKIYPDFIIKFNALLNPESQVNIKSGDLLNTELRVFALIRIGIEDSDKIARFLRCSISTVYTYRSKMRKRALNPDTFEQDIKRID